MRTIRRLLPDIIIALAVAGIMVGAYVAVASSASNSNKAAWLKNPLSLTFQGSSGRSGAVDSVTCSRAMDGLSFSVHVSKPNRLALDLSPTSFSCNSAPLIVSVTATCLVSAEQCRGSYQGIVRIRQSANYRDIPANLQVDIAVT